MLKLEQLSAGQQVTGIEQDKIVRIVSTEKLGEHAINAIYRDGDGRLGERMLFRSDEPSISLAEAGCPWSFDAPPEDFKLALEAQRIKLAYLFDPMMAVHTSDVEPLLAVLHVHGFSSFPDVRRMFVGSGRA